MCVYVHVSMSMDVHMCVCVCVSMSVHVYMFVHVSACMCVCVRVCPPPLRPLINSGMNWYDMVATVIDLTNSVFQLWSVSFVSIDVVLELKCSIYRAILVRVS